MRASLPGLLELVLRGLDRTERLFRCQRGCRLDLLLSGQREEGGDGRARGRGTTWLAVAFAVVAAINEILNYMLD
jgi:hypothetical protein